MCFVKTRGESREGYKDGKEMKRTGRTGWRGDLCCITCVVRVGADIVADPLSSGGQFS